MTLKLSRAGHLRPEAEKKIDEHFAHRINELLGPLAALHALKRISASAHGSLPDNEGDRLAILRRAAEQDEALAALDRRRRELKNQIRAATTAAEIKAILATLG